MTTSELAGILNARHAGRGRWQAKCPAHADRSPSLSIRQADDGRTLIHCFAGCEPQEILAALGLSRRDLFVGPPPSPEQAQRISILRDLSARKADAIRLQRRDLSDHYRRLTRLVGELGAKLAKTSNTSPDGDALTCLFHETLARLRSVESEMGPTQ